MFSAPSAPQQALPEAPPPPPNPPMFGSNSSGTNQVRKNVASNTGYAGTIIGGAGAPAGPGQTSNKTLLGS